MRVVLQHSIFKPGFEIYNFQKGTSISEAIDQLPLPDKSPFLVISEDQCILKKDWNSTKSEIIVQCLPAAELGVGAIIAIISAVVSVSIAVYSFFSMSQVGRIKTQEQDAEADPVYSLGAQRNQEKLNKPIEVIYGRNRIYPSYATRPYTEYQNNEQYLYQIFCLGQGKLDVEQIYLEDTPIENIPEVEYKVYGPGEPVTLFRDRVITSVQVSQLELYAQNEGHNTNNGRCEYGPYVLNSKGTKCDRIEVDVTLPNGFYLFHEKGRYFMVWHANVQFDVRQIDDDGNPLTEWIMLFNESPFGGGRTPRRWTYSAQVSPGRYEIRGYRLGNVANLSNIQDSPVVWEAARAFLTNTENYGNVTMLAMKIRASNNINSNNQNRVNLVVTRILPVYENGSWREKPTRSIVWAMADVITSYYGAKQSYNSLEIDELVRLDNQMTNKNYFFDYVFTQKSSVWNTLGTILRVANSNPIVFGPKFSVTRDELKDNPISVFTEDNILEGTFELGIEFLGVLEKDGVKVTYINMDTWKDEEVYCIPPNSLGDNLEDIRLEGCSNRDHAYQWGMQQTMILTRRRETLSFSTGIEGNIPTKGDLILVSYGIPNWGQSSYVINLDDLTIEVADDLNWSDTEDNYIIFRKDNSSASEIIKVTKGSSNHHLIMEKSPGITWINSLGRDPILILFGIKDNIAKQMVVDEVTNQNNNKFRIKCYENDPEVYKYQNDPAPVDPPPVIPPFPEIPWLNGEIYDSSSLRIYWGSAYGATFYIVEIEENGVWREVGTTVDTEYIFRDVSDTIHVRVSAYNVGKGTPLDWIGSPVIPDELPGEVPGLWVNGEYIPNPGSATPEGVVKTNNGELFSVNLFEYFDSPTEANDFTLINMGTIGGTVAEQVPEGEIPSDPTPSLIIRGFPKGSVIKVINRGKIVGAGGSVWYPNTDGYRGGDAIEIDDNNVTIINYSYIGAGGGAGGGALGWYQYVSGVCRGGGGAGIPGGIGFNNGTEEVGGDGQPVQLYYLAAIYGGKGGPQATIGFPPSYSVLTQWSPRKPGDPGKAITSIGNNNYYIGYPSSEVNGSSDLNNSVAYLEGPLITLSWDVIPNCYLYKISLLDSETEDVLVYEEVTRLTWATSSFELREDNLNRRGYILRFVPTNPKGDGPGMDVYLTSIPLKPPKNVRVTYIGLFQDKHQFRILCDYEQDVSVKSSSVYVGDNADFTPSEDNLKYRGESNIAYVNLDPVNGAKPNAYFIMGLDDYWVDGDPQAMSQAIGA